jgi:hypothetical protein
MGLCVIPQATRAAPPGIVKLSISIALRHLLRPRYCRYIERKLGPQIQGRFDEGFHMVAGQP